MGECPHGKVESRLLTWEGRVTTSRSLSDYPLLLLSPPFPLLPLLATDILTVNVVKAVGSANNLNVDASQEFIALAASFPFREASLLDPAPDQVVDGGGSRDAAGELGDRVHALPLYLAPDVLPRGPAARDGGGKAKTPAGRDAVVLVSIGELALELPPDRHKPIRDEESPDSSVFRFPA